MFHSAIIALNVGVFLLWRIPTLQKFMTRWFTANPLSGIVLLTLLYSSCIFSTVLFYLCYVGLSLPMFLSGFSHMETWHLACNMIVLWSFSPVIHGTVSGFFWTKVITKFVRYYLKMYNGSIDDVGIESNMLDFLQICWVESSS